MKGIRSYEKPLMVVEKFTPNEFVAGCWFVESCYNNLYYDFSNPITGIQNTHNSDDETVVENHGSHRLPAERGTYFNDNDYPYPTETLPNDHNYYTSYTVRYFGPIPFRPYNGPAISGNSIYKYEIDGVTHYFSNPQKRGAHS